MVGESMTNAWAIYKQHLVEWTIFGFVVCMAGTIIPVLGGLILLPATLRETKRAMVENRGPKIGALLDTENLGGDIASMCLYALAQTIGVLMCFVGWPLAWFLFWFTAEIQADARVSVMDGMRVSMAWVTRNIGETIVMMLLSSVIVTIAASFGLGIGVFFAIPFVFIMWASYWESVSESAYAIAREKGIHVNPEAGYVVADGSV